MALQMSTRNVSLQGEVKQNCYLNIPFSYSYIMLFYNKSMLIYLHLVRHFFLLNIFGTLLYLLALLEQPRSWSYQDRSLQINNNIILLKTRGPSGPEIAHLDEADHKLHCAIVAILDIRSDCL